MVFWRQVEATMYSSSSVALKQRTYNVCNDVKYAHRMLPIVTRPGASPDGKPRVLWSKFHDTIPVDGSSTASRAGTVAAWPEQGSLTGPAAPSTEADDQDDDEESDATMTITGGAQKLQRQPSSVMREQGSLTGPAAPSTEADDQDDDEESDATMTITGGAQKLQRQPSSVIRAPQPGELL